MIKKLVIPLVAVALFIVGVGILLQKTSILPPNQTPPPSQSRPTATINGRDIAVELASTTEEKGKGLGGRDTLDTNSGMLFVFGTSNNPQTFWMKGMLIPLDLIWIKDGSIIKIDKNVPAPSVNTPDNKLKTYSAGLPIDYVLEVNGGFSDTNSILVGNSVTLSGI